MYRKYYSLADYTICVESELEMSETTFNRRINEFEIGEIKNPEMTIRHFYSIKEDFSGPEYKEIYKDHPWKIYAHDNTTIYKGQTETSDDPWIIMKVSNDYSLVEVFHKDAGAFLAGDLHTITMSTNDQILFGRAFPEKGGILFHGAGISIGGNGAVFLGHSGAGKTTTVEMLDQRLDMTVLCDDRIIIRDTQDGVLLGGKWHYGKHPTVSSETAELKAIFIVNQSEENKVIPITGMKDKMKNLVHFLINPLTDQTWWNNVFTVIEGVLETVPVYQLHRDLSGKVADLVMDSMGGTR